MDVRGDAVPAGRIDVGRGARAQLDRAPAGATPFAASDSRATSTASGSRSSASTPAAPQRSATSVRIPDPQPRSIQRLPRSTRRSSAAVQRRVVGCSPVPNARPGTSSSGCRPATDGAPDGASAGSIRPAG